MAVAWVAGTSLAIATATSVSANAPAGIQDDDTLLAAVFGRSALTTPSGWTKLVETSTFTSEGGFLQRIAVFSKDTVTSSDASASFTFSQADAERMGICYAVARSVDSVEDVTSSILSDQPDGTFSITQPSITTTLNGSLYLAFASTINGDTVMTPATPTGFTLFTATGTNNLRLAGAYKTSNATDTVSGSFSLDSAPPTGIGTNGLGAVTLLLAPAAAAPVDGWISVSGPLGAPAVESHVYADGYVSVSSPLTGPALLAQHDFTAFLVDDASIAYVMDLVTPGGLVRVPISSWQATLQTDVQSYVQCVVPAATDWVPDIEAATEFVIWRVGTLLDGSSIEYEMARAPAQTVSLDGGAYNYTATISGYTAALTSDEDPPTALDRTLTGVRTVSRNSGNVRVRCSIDWLLRVGHRAYLDDEPIVVAYVNYYVPGFDQYMDVGDRA